MKTSLTSAVHSYLKEARHTAALFQPSALPASSAPLICSWTTSIWFETTARKHLFVFTFHMLNFLAYVPHTGTRWQDFLSSEGEESWWACLYLDIISWPSDDINCKITDPWHMSVWRQESLAHGHTEDAVLQPSIFIYNLPIWSSTRLEDLTPEATSVQPKYPEEETCQEGNWEILGSALLPCPFLSIGRAPPTSTYHLPRCLGKGQC